MGASAVSERGGGSAVCESGAGVHGGADVGGGGGGWGDECGDEDGGEWEGMVEEGEVFV